jgi:hypothetical protein
MKLIQSKLMNLLDEICLVSDLFSRQLDKYAAAIIDRCFDVDRDFAVTLLNRPAVAFYNADPLKLALKANCRSFLASRCVQRHLDNEWYD